MTAYSLEAIRALNHGDDHDDKKAADRSATWHEGEAREQAVELLALGAVEVVTRTERRLVAEVDDSSGERRRVTHDRTCWCCSCPALHHRHSCAHLDAVRLVVAEPGLRRLRPVDHAPPNSLDLKGPIR